MQHPDLVGAEQNRRGQLNAECFGGLEIDDQLEFRGLLDRKIGGARISQEVTERFCNLSAVG
jgi:hypothetical protein